MNTCIKTICISLGLAITTMAQQPAPTEPSAQPAPQAEPQAEQTAEPQAEPAAAPQAEQPAEAPAAPAHIAAYPPPQAPVVGDPVEEAPANPDTSALIDQADEAPASTPTADSQLIALTSQPDSSQTPPADTAKKDSIVAKPDTVTNVDDLAALADSLKKIHAAPVATIDTTKADGKATESRLDKILHGNAYNLVANEAAAAIVAGEMAIPHKMFKRNFAYFEPIEEQGVVSFGQNTTYFFAFDNSNNLALVTAGLAKERFGMLLQAAVGKKWSYVDNNSAGTEETVKGTSAGTALGAAVSAKLAGLDFAVKVAYENPEGELAVYGGSQETDSDIWNLGGKFLVSKAGKSIFWTAGIGVVRFNSRSTTSEKTLFEQDGRYFVATSTTHTTDSTARVEVVPEFNIGWAILKHEKGRVFMGVNTAAPLIAFDRVKGICSRHNEYALMVTPNILGEVMLGKYVVAFGSASHQWDLFRYRDSYINHVSTKTVDISSGVTTANIGFRLEYEIAAVEMAFTKQFLSNPFGSFSNTDEIATSIGMFINF